MPKDYAKFVPPKSRLNLPYQWPVKLAVVISLILLLGGIGVYYYATKHPGLMASLDAVIHPDKVPKPGTKLASAQPPKPRTVRFDFYEQLPNMQMPDATATIPSAPAPAPLLASAPPPKIVPVVVATQPAPAPRQVFNPDELTHMLEAERPKMVPNLPAPHPAASQFMIQMGDFDTEFGAKGLLKAIRSVGFDAKVVKISRSGRTIYQIQQGPYESMALATQTQQRMQKRGLVTSIVKSI
ncbi:MAG: SPOR domain-containing protein [Pseudomonadota bacterium]